MEASHDLVGTKGLFKMQVKETSPQTSESVDQGGNRNLFAPNTTRRKTHTLYVIHFVLDLCKPRSQWQFITEGLTQLWKASWKKGHLG